MAAEHGVVSEWAQLVLRCAERAGRAASNRAPYAAPNPVAISIKALGAKAAKQIVELSEHESLDKTQQAFVRDCISSALCKPELVKKAYATAGLRVVSQVIGAQPARHGRKRGAPALVERQDVINPPSDGRKRQRREPA